MAFDYVGIRDSVVITQLANFGKDATLEQPGETTGPDYDPTPGVPTVYAVKVLEVEFTLSDKSGGLVQSQDRKFMLSPDGQPAPGLDGTLTVDGVTLQIIKVEPSHPGPTIMFWRLHCRK